MPFPLLIRYHSALELESWVEAKLDFRKKACIFHTNESPVIHASKKVLITEHGRKIATIVPIVEPDRKRALQMLTAIGPVEMPDRR